MLEVVVRRVANLETLAAMPNSIVTLRLEGGRIGDRAAFHKESARIFGFPDFYGQNMDAWIDCLSYLRDGEAEMTEVVVGPEELVQVEVVGTEDFRKRLPDVFADFIDCTGFVNARCVDAGEEPVLTLTFL